MKLSQNYKETLTETVLLLPRYIDKILINIDDSINLLNQNESFQDEISKIYDDLSNFISLVSIIFR